MGEVEYADNYEEKLRDVIDNKLPKYIEDNSAQKKETNVDSGDDDDQSEISIPEFEPWNKIVYKTESPTEKYAPLLKALGQCPALNLGFHTKEQKRLCFCPFGYKMRIWCEKYGYNIPNQDQCSDRGDKKGSTQGFLPFGLVSHLRNKKDARDPMHAIVLKFLECLYQGHTAPGYFHKDFYPLNSRDYKLVEKAEKEAEKDAENGQRKTTTSESHSQVAATNLLP